MLLTAFSASRSVSEGRFHRGSNQTLRLFKLITAVGAPLAEVSGIFGCAGLLGGVDIRSKGTVWLKLQLVSF
jgi:hypothetical protein